MRQQEFVLYEDRPGHRIGLKLAVLSLRASDPGIHVHVHSPGDEPSREWFEGLGNLSFDSTPVAGVSGWNVKPTILLKRLNVTVMPCWFDSDMVTTAPLAPVLDQHPEGVLVTTEETFWGQAQGGTHRAIGLGLSPGRSLGSTLNTGILRVDRSHAALLRAWETALSHPGYLAAQKGPWQDRPIHWLGDQEVLTGLLGSTDYADVGFAQLRRGRDIAQCFGPAGYTPRERLHTLATGRGPLVVHAMGRKPWESVPEGGDVVARLRHGYDRLHVRRSPYMSAAAPLAPRLPETPFWLQTRPSGPRLAALKGLPLAVLDHCVRWLRARTGVGRIRS